MSAILRPDFPNPPPDRHTSEGGASPGAPLAMPPGEASIRLLCKTLERAALTKEQRFRRWLVDNPVMERNPYARQWFENAEASRLWSHADIEGKDYQEEREGDWTR